MSYTLLKAIQAYEKHSGQHQEYLIESYDDLIELPIAAPGSIAYTPGYTEIYELGFDGTWGEVGSGSGEDGSEELIILIIIILFLLIEDCSSLSSWLRIRLLIGKIIKYITKRWKAPIRARYRLRHHSIYINNT